MTPTRTEIIIMATRTQNVLGEKGRRIRELTSLVQKRFNFPEGTVELYAEKVNSEIFSMISDQLPCLRSPLLLLPEPQQVQVSVRAAVCSTSLSVLRTSAK